MKCSKCKDKLYLYSELSSDEKLSIDKHLSDCEDCSIHFQAIRDMNMLVGKVSKVEINYPNTEFLTTAIMDKIESVDSSNSTSPNRAFGFIPLLKYSLAVLSFGLVVFFYVEASQSGQITRKYEMSEGGNLTKLSSLNLKEWMEERKTKRNVPFWKNCIRNNESDSEVRACIEDYLSSTSEN